MIAAPPPTPWDTGAASAIGARPEMEDRHVLVKQAGWLFGGVYDGHGGAEIVNLVAERLHPAFLEALGRGRPAEEAFLDAYEVVDRAAVSPTSGATAMAFFLVGDRLVVANVGDGRAVIVRTRDHRQLTRDHRLDDSRERQRILDAGGRIEWPYVIRADRGLMVTRSLGDTFFRPAGVIAAPDVSSYAVTSDDLYLVVGCDGLWDVLSNADVAQLVRAASSAQGAAGLLAREVQTRRGRDNLTILIVRLSAGATPSAGAR